MSKNNTYKRKIISTDYAKGSDYNDSIPDFNNIEGPDPRDIDDENYNQKYTMKLFPDPDW